MCIITHVNVHVECYTFDLSHGIHLVLYMISVSCVCVCEWVAKCTYALYFKELLTFFYGDIGIN